jgi:uncharacterized membrane protein
MATPDTPNFSPRRSRVAATLNALVRTRITAGLITVLPIVLTLWIVMVIFRWLRDASQWVVVAVLDSAWFKDTIWRLDESQQQLRLQDFLDKHPALDWGISIFSVLLTFALLYIIGMFTANMIGRRVLGWLDVLVDRLPLVKTVYRTLKQILEVFGGDQTQNYQRVALVPFPNQVTRSVGFITNTLRDAVTGEELCAVFLPTTPNPTTGYVFMLRRSDIIELNWSIEDAIKVIMSGGILAPEYVTMITGHTLGPGGVTGAVPGPVQPAGR